MTQERLEKLWNKIYYDYLDDSEFNELLNYYKDMEQENKHLNLQLDQALKDYEELLIKIDKAIDFIDNWEKYTKEKRPLEVSMLDLLYIKEILGDKE